MSRYNDDEYFKLYLKAYKNCNSCYSPFSLGLMIFDVLLDAGRDALVDVLSSSENTNIKLLSEVIEYGRSFRAKRFSQ